MNVKQAIALAVGTVAALVLVLIPRTMSRPHLVTSRTLPNGEIEDDFRAQPSLWQPVAFAVVVLCTGACVFTLRRKD